MLLRNQTAAPCPMKGGKAAQVACGRVRANRNDSPAGVGVLWRRGCNPTLTPGDGFERADLCRSPGHLTNEQGGLHTHTLAPVSAKHACNRAETQRAFA